MLPILLLATASIAAAQTPVLLPDFADRLAALEQAREAHPDDPRVLDALAGSYAMEAEYGKAIAVLEHMRALNPADLAVELRLARNYAWSGNMGRAIATYDSYLQAVQDREATIELIRLRRYRGDYSKAEELCNRLLSVKPDDAEVLALKAEVLHWAGDRRILARQTADRGVALAPSNPDARISQVYASLDLGENGRASSEFTALSNQLGGNGVARESTYHDAYKLLQGMLAKTNGLSFSPGFSVYNDSDGIHDTFWGWSVEQRIADDHKLIMDVARYRSSAPMASIFTDGRDRAELNTFRAGGQVRVAPSAYLTLLGGGSNRTSDALRPVFNARFTASPIDRWTFDLSAGREFLGVTPRAIDRDIASISVAGAVRFAMDPRTFVSIRADRRYWSDNNRSILSEAALRKLLHRDRRVSIDAGLLSHWEQFDRDTKLESGFFTPDRYWRHDGSLGLHGEAGIVAYDLQGSGGGQQVARRSDFRPDWDLSSTISASLGRWFRLSASYQRRSYSLISKDGWYQGFQFTLWIKQ